MMYQLIISLFETSALTIMFSTISILLEKNGSAIVACLFIPTGATLLLTLCDNYLKLGVSKYWIENVSDMFASSLKMGDFWLSIICYIIYIVLFMIIGNYLFKKKEIK